MRIQRRMLVAYAFGILGAAAWVGGYATLLLCLSNRPVQAQIRGRSTFYPQQQQPARAAYQPAYQPSRAPATPPAPVEVTVPAEYLEVPILLDPQPPRSLGVLLPAPHTVPVPPTLSVIHGELFTATAPKAKGGPAGACLVWAEVLDVHDGDTVRAIVHLPFGTDIREAAYRAYGYDTCEVDFTRKNAKPPVTVAETAKGKQCRDDFKALLAQPNTYLLFEDPFLSTAPGQTYDRTEARFVVWQSGQMFDVARWMTAKGYLREQLVPPPIVPAQ